MAVITISRQYGSGGDEIADRVCELLGYHHFDKRLLKQAAVESGLSDHDVIDYTEENYRVKSFIERLTGRPIPVAKVSVWREDPSGVRSAENLILSDDVAISLVQKAVRASYQAGEMVIVGRGGQFILKDHPDVLSVRIEAPMEDRIQRVKSQMKDDQKAYRADVSLRRDAQDLIVTRDYASADYIKQYYGVDWEDSLLYHIVLNTGKLSLEQAAQTIVELVRRMEAEREAVPA
jgi:cytidylate kinase